ncbi:hypothetical protein ACHWQZ_G005657 [Mnemiopsis leidyi]
MKVLLSLSVLLITIAAIPTPQDDLWQGSTDNIDLDSSQSKQKTHENQNHQIQKAPTQAHEAKPDAKAKADPTKAPTDKTNGTSTNSTKPAEHCSNLVTSIATSGIAQDCTVHDDCMGACCQLNLLAHNMSYNFSVKPCESPAVQLEFNITDIQGSTIKNEYKSSESITIPHGNMSYVGMYETESNLDIVLEKVLDITHFRLDFGVHYRVLKSDPLKPLFTHTLIPMLSLEFTKDVCVKPTEPPAKVTKPMSNGDEDKIFGVIPKEYVKDKTKLAMVGTIVALAVVVLIGLIYFVVARKRNQGGFYRTYISTDENRHLTKGNDGFEPLDDSDID